MKKYCLTKFKTCGTIILEKLYCLNIVWQVEKYSITTITTLKNFKQTEKSTGLSGKFPDDIKGKLS